MSKFAQKKRHLHDCMVSRITAPKDIHALTPGICEYTEEGVCWCH